MFKSLPHLILLFILFNTKLTKVQSLKCHQCFSEVECNAMNPLVECNYKSVQDTAYHFRFLPNVMNQAPVEDFYCARYTGFVNNKTALLLSGCFYGSYNPCAFVTGTDSHNMEYRCKYCNHHDGCNAAATIGVSVTLFLLYLVTTIV